MKTKAISLIAIGFILIITGFVINRNDSAKKQITAIENTEIVNRNSFTNLISKKFASKYFTVNKLDKNNQFAGADLKVEYKLKGKTGVFYLKTKWVKQYNNKYVEFKSNEIIKFKKYSQNNREEYFYIIGVGGDPSMPELLFAVPVEVINKNRIEIEKLSKYKKTKVESNFYFDLNKKMLK